MRHNQEEKKKDQDRLESAKKAKKAPAPPRFSLRAKLAQVEGRLRETPDERGTFATSDLGVRSTTAAIDEPAPAATTERPAAFSLPVIGPVLQALAAPAGAGLWLIIVTTTDHAATERADTLLGPSARSHV